MIEIVDGIYLIRVVLIAIGLSYIITGSQIGFWPRVIWWHATSWIPILSLETLVLCPSCNAWWSGLVTALLTGASIDVATQCAIVACVVAAIVQSQFGLAAADEDRIRGIFKRKSDEQTEQR